MGSTSWCFSGPAGATPSRWDVKALLRIAMVYNIPIACNRASADFMFASPIIRREYRRFMTDAKEQIRDAETASVF